jgi:foldase protein PrsA
MGCGSRPAVIVNGAKITEAELNKRLRQQAGKQVLASLIETQIIRDAFKKQGLQITQDDINQAITEGFGSTEVFQQRAAQAGINPDEFTKEVLEPRIMLEKLATKDLKYTDADVQQFYEKHQDDYNVSQKVAFRLIAVPDKATADKVTAALKGGADFAAVVKQYSTDPGTRETGGLVPPTDPKALRPPLGDIINGLKEGQYSEPKQAGSEWLIVKLEKRQAAEKRTFDQVKTQVLRDYLRSKLTPDAIMALRNKLRQEAKVNVVSPEFQSLNEEFRPTPVPEFGAGGGQPPAAPGQPGAATPPAPTPAPPAAAPPAAPAAPAAPGG